MTRAIAVVASCALALGAAAMDRWSRLRAPGLMTGSALIILLSCLAWLSHLLLEAGLVGGLLSSSSLLLACGFLVAAIFAYSSLHRMPDQRLVISPLYASDLLGGCLGSLAATLFLIPMLGLSSTALLTAVIVAIALMLV